jgi:hypothetical protein
MKRIFTFDSYDASAYDVLDALYPVRSLPGVRSVEVLTAVEGSPRYCIILDVEDDKDAAIAARADSLKSQYAGYYSNLTIRAFKKVG